jgi:exosome complex protein LRP1
VRHGLAGNERYDRERAEKVAKERARAALKAKRLGEKQHMRFDDEVESKRMAVKLPSTETEQQAEDDAEDDKEDGEAEENDVESENEELYGAEATTPKDDAAPPKKKAREAAADRRSSSRKEINAARREKKKKHRAERTAAALNPTDPETIVPAKGVPKTHSETFKALLEGPLEKKDNGKKGKGRGK